MKKMGNAIGGDDNTTQRRGVGDAVSRKESVGRDQMDGNMSSSAAGASLRMEAGNILEAKGRDTSNNTVDVDGWAGGDVAYKGLATDAPYSGSMKK